MTGPQEIERNELRRMPVRRGARTYAMSLVDRAAGAVLRLHDSTDAEALHDFRVSIRRLRSFHRAFADDLPFGPRTVRRLKKLARSTNGPRDVEVGLAWLAAEGQGLTARQRVGYEWLVGRLDAEKDEAYRWVRASIPLRWMKSEGRLRDALRRPFSDALGAPTFGRISAERIGGFADEMERQLALVGTIDDVEHAHDARICAKRVRYLLDPFKGAVEGVKEATRSLSSMQDVLGDLNDCNVMLARLRRDIRDAAADRAERLLELATAAEPDESALRSARARDERPGLVEIARRAERRRTTLFEQARERWFAGGAAAMLGDVRYAAERVGADGPGAGPDPGAADADPAPA